MGFLSSLVNAGVQAYGINEEKNIANQNLQFQKENLAYQKELQNTIFAREDNAVQRRAKDLEAAGLSKTLAAGSSANAGQVVSTTAPHMDSGYARGYQNLKFDLDLVGSLSDMIQKVNDAKQSNYATDVAANNAAINKRDFNILMGLDGNVLSKYAGDPVHQVYNAIVDHFFKGGSNPSENEPSPSKHNANDFTFDYSAALREAFLSEPSSVINNMVRQKMFYPSALSYQDTVSPATGNPIITDALDKAVSGVGKIVGKLFRSNSPAKYAGGGGYNYKAVYVK